MKERPILFSGEMVRAILEGRKTQTRRVVKPQPIRVHSLDGPFKKKKGEFYVGPDLLPTENGRSLVIAHCEGPGTLHCMGQKAFVENFCPYGLPGDRLWGWKWKPAIFMPREASRITLEIVSVRVEQVQDISDADIEAEGTPLITPEHKDDNEAVSRFWMFQQLWDRINGKTHPWSTNPWVWVIAFRRIANQSGKGEE